MEGERAELHRFGDDAARAPPRLQERPAGRCTRLFATFIKKGVGRNDLCNVNGNGWHSARNLAHRLLELDSVKVEVITFPKLLDIIYGRSQLKIIFPSLSLHTANWA